MRIVSLSDYKASMQRVRALDPPPQRSWRLDFGIGIFVGIVLTVTAYTIVHGMKH